MSPVKEVGKSILMDMSVFIKGRVLLEKPADCTETARLNFGSFVA
jgi:hypothetical protein